MNAERLEKLAHHLIVGKLGVDHFDFRTVLDGLYVDGHLCGTVGCAMGELPAAFPEEWKRVVKESLDHDIGLSFTHTGPGIIEPMTRLPGCLDNTDNVSTFFDLSHEEFRYLFLPYYTDDDCSGYLLPDATAEEVGQHIRDFVRTGRMREDPCSDDVGEAEERADERRNKAMLALEAKLAAQPGGAT